MPVLETGMSVDSLRCRIWGGVPGGRERGLRALLRAARAGLRLGRSRSEPSRASGSRPGRARCGGTRRCFPPARRRTPRAALGLTPLLPAPRLAERGRRRRGVAEARPHEPDALVQGPRRRGRRREGARARQRHARVRVDRQSRQRGRRARRCERHALGRPLSRAPSSPRRCCDRGLRRRDVRRARQLRRLLAAGRRARRRARLGVRQRQPARVLRGGLEDARVRDRRAARLGDSRRSRRARSPRGRCSRSSGKASSSSARLGARRRRQPAPLRRPGAGLRARRARVRRERPVSPVRPATVAHSLAIGAPADGDLAIATARTSGGADLCGARGRRRPEHVAARLRRAGSSARRPRASPSAPCALRRGGAIGETTAWSCSSPDRPEDAAGRRVGRHRDRPPTSTSCSRAGRPASPAAGSSPPRRDRPRHRRDEIVALDVRCSDRQRRGGRRARYKAQRGIDSSTREAWLAQYLKR